MRLIWEPTISSAQGVDRGVLYFGSSATLWAGLISVDIKTTESVDTDYYIDGVRRLVVQENGDFEAKVSAYTYPPELDEVSEPFGFTYRTEVGDHHEIHVVYNAVAVPGTASYVTSSETAQAMDFEWDILASAVELPDARPVAHFVIDTSQDESITEEVENLLYGSDISDARLPLFSELVEIFESATTLTITYNPDGSWTASGPDDMVWINPDGSFTIDSPSLTLGDDGRFTVSSH